MTAPLVSILIPCYNAEKYVGEAIESALGQTHPHVEVVVVDDGSTDRSLDVVKSFGDRIRWEAGPNRGGCSARNRALELSSGEFVQFLDADDLIEPDKVARQIPMLIAGQADLILCKIGLLWPLPRSRAAEKKAHPPPAPNDDSFEYFWKNPIGTPAPLHRRSVLEKVGGFRVGLRRGQEADLHLRLGAANVRLSMVDEVLVWVRMHDGPRVSLQQLSHGEHLANLRLMTHEMLAAGQMSDGRARLLSKSLVRSSIEAFREGQEQLAREGFRLASQLGVELPPNEPMLIRTLRRLVGCHNTERLMKPFLRLVRTRRNAVQTMATTIG